MSPLVSAYLFQGLKDDKTAKQVLEPLARRLRTKHPSATIDRLFTSRHVYDLRLIAAVSLIVLVYIVVIAAITAICTGYMESVADTKLSGFDAVAHASIAGAAAFTKLVVPSVVAFFGVLTWAYQAGNGRLGVVDLFACEIDTICRVLTITDTVRNLVNRYSRDRIENVSATVHEPSGNNAFSSEENYFPILDSSGTELQKLEAKVVTHITAFYTYIKAVRDYLRQAANRPPSAHPHTVHEPHLSTAELLSPPQDAARNALYSLYLALESGRKAITYLVEFEPEQTEHTIVILISELPAYRFLRDQFPTEGEMRHDRLALRQPDYEGLVNDVRLKVEKHKHTFLQSRRTAAEPSQDDPENQWDQEDKDHAARQWCAAYRLLSELNSRYEGINNLPLDPVVREISRLFASQTTPAGLSLH